jgi:hypothetical protein
LLLGNCYVRRLSVYPKQVALRDNVNFPWSKMKFLRSKKVPYEQMKKPKKQFSQGMREVLCRKK